MKFPTLHVQITTSLVADEKTQRILDDMHRRLIAMSETIASLQQKVDANTASITLLQDTVDTVQSTSATAFADLATQVADLKKQLASGTPVSQADLDALGTALDTQAAAIAAVTQDVASTPIPSDTPTPPAF